MIDTIKEAQAYALHKRQERQKAEISPEEVAALKDSISLAFQEKLLDVLTEEQVAQLAISDPEEIDVEELEPQLFYLVPKYVTLLHEATKQVLASWIKDVTVSA